MNDAQATIDAPKGVKSKHSSGPPARSVEQRIEQFGSLYFGAAKALLKAGALLCELVDELPDAYTTLIGRYPVLSRSSLERLESIGRGRLLPELALDDSPAAAHLAKLPLETQKMLTTRPIEVLGPDGVTTPKPYKQLSHRECRQVFDGARVREVEEQKQWRASQPPTRIDAVRFSIDDAGNVTFREGCTFSAGQLEAIAEQAKLAAVRSVASGGVKG